MKKNYQTKTAPVVTAAEVAVPERVTIAMGELARCGLPGAIGCTQVTEILYTPGVVLAAMLPREFELATTYSAAVCTKAAAPDLAARFVEWMCGERSAPLRTAGGFEG